MNHIASPTRDPERPRDFYAELPDAENLEGAHGALRVGAALLVLFETDFDPVMGHDPEGAFAVDADTAWSRRE